jgi:outer membrane protein assembly factor BamB
MKNSKTVTNLIFIFILFLFYNNLYPQTLSKENYQFISPIPGSYLHFPETSIIIRQGDLIDHSTIDNNKVMAIGSRSGIHHGNLILSPDKKTLIFKPSSPFTLGEEVTVKLIGGILTYSGIELAPIQFAFQISERVNIGYYRNLNDEIFKSNKFRNNYIVHSQYSNPVNINLGMPADFPDFTISISNNPSPGYIFFSPWLVSDRTGYLMIIDNQGIPIYYQKSSYPMLDFKKQNNGLLTYWSHIRQKFFEMDSAYNIIDSFKCGNGYPTDAHELLVLPNGHSFVMSYDPQVVRMDSVILGGDSAAVVYGLAIQELDASKNVIFQWRSWDHFDITDATDDVDLTAHSIDYVHGNAIEVDYDGNLLISCRNMDEITKIDRQTGDIIWRLGGLKAKNNQFVFINNPITFSHQHDIRRLPNGNITLFDNGNLHSPAVTRSLEYQLNEENKIVVLVWKFNNDPVTFAPAMGNSQRLTNNNTIIGWGYHLNPRAVSEIKVDGTPALEILFPDTMTNYRAFKFPWKTNLFDANPDSIFFESVPVGDSSIIYVSIENNSSQLLNITGFYNKNNMYNISHALPFSITPYGSEELPISFKPNEDGYFKDHLYIISDNDCSRIAQVMVLAGRTDSIFSNIQNDEIITKFSLEQNYPNPFNPSTTIQYQIPESGFTTLKIYDVLGREILTLINEEQSAGKHKVDFDASGFNSGIYFYRLQAGSFIETKKMVLMK